MKCPNDAATLVMSERSGVEIDYCPECRGVWLDRGELDKILERAASAVPEPTRNAEPRFDDRSRGFDPSDRYDSRGNSGYGHGRKKKESWLSELFD
ncbi:MAG TPA: zf-TFIIB domain-containing protein [Homoserinimonas sp.]|nr:zf-TFIIB domain-containing protein [Homoserinimonas sp.]